MPLPEGFLRVAIAGAASLRGQDLKMCIEDSGFPAGEVRLFDEEPLAGTLTGMAGEPAVIQAIDEDSFRGLRFAFFAGSRAFAKQHGVAAARNGVGVVDLTGALADVPGARPWIPRLDALLAAPKATGKSDTAGQVWIAPSSPAIVACAFCCAVAEFKPVRVAMNFFQPASERGKEGVEEMSAQTVKLLSLQPAPQDVFDCQVAFNMLDRWGPESVEKLADVRSGLAREVREYLGGRVNVPALTLIQAPVFYGHAFSVFVEFGAAIEQAPLSARLESAGFANVGDEDMGPSNISVAGESKAAIGAAVPDAAIPHGYWFWGAADNLRLATSNATQIAEKILVS